MLKQSLTDEIKFANKKMAEVWIECASHHSRAHCGCHCAWSGQEHLVNARFCSPSGSGTRQAELGGCKLGLCSTWLLSADHSRAHCGCHCAWSGQENLVDARFCSPTEQAQGRRNLVVGNWGYVPKRHTPLRSQSRNTFSLHLNRPNKNR